MFKKVTSTPGFWRSVLSLGIVFSFLFTIIKWAVAGFKITFFYALTNSYLFVLGLFIGGFIYGFLVTFGKFRAKIIKKDL
tara:strand:+ start:178 stop:417 length:240 start_codon:yes stop_codon:yes gene_type:complete